MMSMFRLAIPIGWLLALAVSAPADEGTPSDETVQAIRQAKAAIALVSKKSTGGFGTAFCIHPSGLFATNRDVVAGDVGSEVELIIDPDQPAPRKVAARVVRTDVEADLTLLQAEGDAFAYLPLGDSENLVETARVIAVGFPKGVPTDGKDPNPSPMVTAGAINSLRLTDGRLRMIVIGTDRAAGNVKYGIGGPLMDARGRVIGVMHYAGSSRVARPVADLQQLLAKPLVALNTFSIEETEIRQPRQFAVTVLSSQKPAPDWNVELEFQPGSTESRRFIAQRGEDGVYRATAPLLIQAPSAELRIDAAFQDGAIQGRVQDRELHVGDDSVWLRQIRRMELAPPGELTKVVVDGKELRGNVGGLEAVSVDLGTISLTMDLSRARTISVEPIAGATKEITYRIVVREQETVAGESTGTIAIAPRLPEHADALKPENRTVVSQPAVAVPAAQAPKPELAAESAKAFQSKVVELTDQTPANWSLQEARVGATWWSNRKYAFTSLPKEMQGGTLVMHDTGHSGWLTEGAVRAVKDCAVFAIVRTQDHDNSELDEVTIAKFVREGWDEVEEQVTTDVDRPFNWRWKTFRKQVEAGEETVQLQTINFGKRCVIFIFQDAAAVKPFTSDERKPRLPKNAFRSEVIEFTDDASVNWLLKEARAGTPIWSDKGYALAKLPKEIVGGTLVWRDSGSSPRLAMENLGGPRTNEWLEADTVKALKDCRVYAIVRWKYLGKVEIGEVTFEKLEREGWKDAGEVQTTFPNGEDWRWKAFVKDVPQGDVTLQLKTVNWGTKAVVFVFK